MKIIWLCHFTNEFVQGKLGINKKVNQFAPWISIGIREAAKRNDIELHVIAPHRWITKTTEFTDGNIHYHFFNSGLPFTGRHWPSFFRFDSFTNFYFNRKIIHRLINKINPDLVHLHGAENDYYSTAVLGLDKNIPVLMTVQGFLKEPKKRAQYSLRKRMANERRVIGALKHFGVRTAAMSDTIKKMNDDPVLHWHEYFLNTPDENDLSENITDKKYDLIFFSRITKAKGIEDFIQIVSTLLNDNNKLKAAVIGLSSPEYLEELKQLAKSKNCIDNIDFLGFLPTQEDVYKVLNQSKVFVLPTYNDALPGSIMECMFRKIPVVSYITGGIPEINRDDENLLLFEQGDVSGMTEKIRFLLGNEEARKTLADKAYSYAQKKWNNKLILDDLVNIYKKIKNDEIRR